MLTGITERRGAGPGWWSQLRAARGGRAVRARAESITGPLRDRELPCAKVAGQSGKPSIALSQSCSELTRDYRCATGASTLPSQSMESRGRPAAPRRSWTYSAKCLIWKATNPRSAGNRAGSGPAAPHTFRATAATVSGVVADTAASTGGRRRPEVDGGAGDLVATTRQAAAASAHPRPARPQSPTHRTEAAHRPHATNPGDQRPADRGRSSGRRPDGGHLSITTAHPIGCAYTRSGVRCADDRPSRQHFISRQPRRGRRFPVVLRRDGYADRSS